ncbi:DUF4240 domain-containing protein [Streptomyces albidoflavus]|uniref:DUF4240 domain-containing protein n=1 Tax=Streptomyces TaxID=1883 RepID=UPI00099C22D1|nr:DUF4240 domain-containing protein [Streptomyces sp. KE1]
MDNETFWDVIERSREHAQRPDDWLSWLRGQPAGLPVPAILQFQTCLDRVLVPAFTWDLWAAADRISGWCSDDSFFSFRLWLVGQGRGTFERVARDPDALADVPEVQRLAGRPPRAWSGEEWPAWEQLDYVAGSAFQDVTGKTDDDFHDALYALCVEDLEPGEPVGEQWDARRDEEAARRLPHLSKAFPSVEGAQRVLVHEVGPLVRRELTQAAHCRVGDGVADPCAVTNVPPSGPCGAGGGPRRRRGRGR